MSPSLVSFDAMLVASPESALDLLPHPLPLQAFCITLDTRLTADVQGVLNTLSHQLPQLTRLQLLQLDADQMIPQLALTGLSSLSSLQHLAIDVVVLLQCIDPALATLPSLTALELSSRSVRLSDSSCELLAGLSRLRSLRVMTLNTNNDLSVLLHAVRRMQGLTELALGCCLPAGSEQEELQQLLPPGVMLQRLVLKSQGMHAAAMRVLGQYVDDICLESHD